MTTDLNNNKYQILQKFFDDFADGCSDYYKNNFDTLNKGERKKIKDAAKQLRDIADDLAATDAADMSDELNNAINETIKVTGDIKKSLQALNDIQKRINIVSCVVSVGQNLITKNPFKIMESANDLLEKWNV